jgi:hypothetical protein
VKKLTQRQLQRDAKKLIREDRMPSLETLCAAVLETRKKYRLKILRARREARKEVVVVQ